MQEAEPRFDGNLGSGLIIGCERQCRIRCDHSNDRLYDPVGRPRLGRPGLAEMNSQIFKSNSRLKQRLTGILNGAASLREAQPAT